MVADQALLEEERAAVPSGKRVAGGRDRKPQGHRSEDHMREQKTETWVINRVLFLAGLSNVIEATAVN